jgi:hypothetical protein
VKAAIIGARQEAAALSKDGKTLLGPVLPRLLARHNTGSKSGQEWRNKGVASHKAGDKATSSRPSFPRRVPTAARKPAASGKENARKNATSPAAAKPPAKAAGDP